MSAASEAPAGATEYHPADPYLAWARRTGYAGHAAAASQPKAPIPLLMRGSVRQRETLRAKGLARIADAWVGDRGDFFTATADRGQLEDVERSVDAMEFALPIAAGELSTESLPTVAAQTDAVLAVIDHGCAFLNATFCQSDPESASDREHLRKTRFVALWDQGHGAAVGSRWNRPAGFGYGRELDGAAIDKLLAKLPAEHKTEADLYKELDYLQDGTGRLRDTAHGTHVLDTLAGGVDANPPRSTAKPLSVDPASRAPLIFVDVPSSTSGDTTGASNGAFLLDALRYIRHRAGEDVPVVVNISLGAFAGPHDGSSLIELAIDDFIANDGHILVTVAAGNAALERWHANGEFEAGDGSEAELCWRTMPEDTTDSFLEIWFAAVDEKDGPAELQIRVTPPGGKATAWLKADQQADIDGSGAERTLGAVIGRPLMTKQSDGMFLVAIGPTAGQRRMAPPGLWRIALRNGDALPGARRVRARFDAWIQRDEPAWGAGPPSVQSYFESASPGVTLGGAAGGLSSLATGSKAIVVGATSAEDGRLTRYSSQGGPPRRGGGERRDIHTAAPADESQTLIGLLAAGVPSFTLVRMGGTSVAAPVAARRIYDDLVLQQKPSAGSLLEQARELLRGCATKTHGRGPSVPLLLPGGSAPVVPPKPGASPRSAWWMPKTQAGKLITWLRRFIIGRRQARLGYLTDRP